MELVVLAVVVLVSGYFLLKQYLEEAAIDREVNLRIKNLK